ncbi:CsgE family curli-type amyloid fiber assembly protein [Dyadobacter sp. 32]|uniref:CsgE family curli-type amyloid fiber assembly protein n=1 Tax=Dyadobacter sp. 32 TaxID=538966 RepID=UPI0011EBFBDE
MKFTLVLPLLILISFFVSAQSEERLIDDKMFSNQPLEESGMEEDGSMTFILDNTKTKVGRDMYEEFYRQWSGMQLDSTAMAQFKASIYSNEELLIELEEIPSPGINNIVGIKVGDLLVWQQFVQPRLEAMELQVAEAVQQVLQYFISYQEIQSELGSADQSGSGIF